MRSVWPAALVHVFTALGAVCGLLAARAVFTGAWEVAFGWLGLALIIDGVDGMLARRVGLPDSLPRFSGDRLDLVVDYVTYVFVPALALLQAGFLSGGWGLVCAGLILLSSLFHFSDTESKAEDYSFVGFPAVWNIVAFYVFALALPGWATTLLVLVCVAFTFVPLKWAHPLRTPALWPITIAAMGLWGLTACVVVWSGFPAAPWAKAILVLVAIYGIGLTAFAGRAR